VFDLALCGTRCLDENVTVFDFRGIMTFACQFCLRDCNFQRSRGRSFFLSLLRSCGNSRERVYGDLISEFSLGIIQNEAMFCIAATYLRTNLTTRHVRVSRFSCLDIRAWII